MLIISAPLQGIYICPNTPGSKVPSHGTSGFGEEYAVDFVMIKDCDGPKKPYKRSFIRYLMKGLDLADFYGWGQPVYSPMAGEVTEIEDGVDERCPVSIFRDYKNALKVTRDYMKNDGPSRMVTGNFVMIKSDMNLYVLLAHLKKNSVKVKKGQRINEHDEVAQLGHSGNSMMPHLHMQIMDDRDYKMARGIPFVFKEYEVKKGNEWIAVIDDIPKRQDVVRFSAG
jgi:murein DD-endopeptidase MepM/ murein hydrolase activator NlpD